MFPVSYQWFSVSKSERRLIHFAVLNIQVSCNGELKEGYLLEHWACLILLLLKNGECAPETWGSFLIHLWCCCDGLVSQIEVQVDFLPCVEEGE